MKQTQQQALAAAHARKVAKQEAHDALMARHAEHRATQARAMDALDAAWEAENASWEDDRPVGPVIVLNSTVYMTAARNAA